MEVPCPLCMLWPQPHPSWLLPGRLWGSGPLLTGYGMCSGCCLFYPGWALYPQQPHFPQILLLIDIEQSYINTNHEDFIGFAKYVLLGDSVWWAAPREELGFPQEGRNQRVSVIGVSS